jgi:hypothetical protein
MAEVLVDRKWITQTSDAMRSRDMLVPPNTMGFNSAKLAGAKHPHTVLVVPSSALPTGFHRAHDKRSCDSGRCQLLPDAGGEVASDIENFFLATRRFFWDPHTSRQ